MTKNILLAVASLICCANVAAQRFFNLSADEVRIDSVLPQFSHSYSLGAAYADSTYQVEIAYPEFIDMSREDVARYRKIDQSLPPAMPVVNQRIVVERKKGILELYFTPIVYRDGKYRKLVSFMLKKEAKAKGRRLLRQEASGVKPAERYAQKSVLATGTWAKIRVPSTGVYQITDELVRRAGFSDPSKVKVYGYGGALHDEQLNETSIMAYDDLKEVATCTVNGKRLFHAVGTVTWDSQRTLSRTRNPYSDYGYYFLTQSDGEPLQVDSAAFVSSFYPSADDYHALHEKDEYAWYEGGRNLFERQAIRSGQSAEYTLSASAASVGGRGRVGVFLTADGASNVQIAVNDSVVGTIMTTAGGEYDHGRSGSDSYVVKELKADNKVTLTVRSGNIVRLDYISLVFNDPKPEPRLSQQSFPVPEYVYNITNQNHHADKAVDMVIIVPTSGLLTAQAQRLKEIHEKKDGMTVRIVPADELYNEFSSGTPEADAYRLYMKMLYDRTTTDEELPKYLLLFGDALWDNRMLTADLQSLNPDDYLLCFESENSFSSTDCFVDEGYFCALDDGEGANASAQTTKTDKYDIAVGRFPVVTVEKAKVMVDKTIDYINNVNAGEWQNVAMFMGDDGNFNAHIQASDETAKILEQLLPEMQVKRVFWDMYPMEVSATGNTYPEVTDIIVKQQNAGALLMNYSGHGRADMISHEHVLSVSDFTNFKNKGLSMWVTVSCDIMPFDGTINTIGEEAVLNPNGGAVAFFGTTRTVYTTQNKAMDQAYIKFLFTKSNGKYHSIGEAQRLAKNELITSGKDTSRNKLHYSVLGDPALVLNIPENKIVIDSINGICLKDTETLPKLKAGSKARVQGHMETADGTVVDNYNGIAKVEVFDSKEKRVGKVNNKDKKTGTGTAYEYYDYIKTIFLGSDSIKAGKLDISFAVTKDINYSNDNGRLNVFAIDRDNNSANGYSTDFLVGETADLSTDSIGPSIYCYLNNPSFSNRDNVNPTPFFYAELQDKDGINSSGSGIGHDMQLVIDDDPRKTYSLNDNFSYDFGSYTKGTTYYYIPELESGAHRLKFTVWDILNNPSSMTLDFNVVHGLKPALESINCTNNPARESTTFIVNHDRGGSDIEVCIEVFDMSGRMLWRHQENGVSATSTYTYDWNLCNDAGGKLQTGVYLYRVRLSSDGSSEVSKAKKLIIIN